MLNVGFGRPMSQLHPVSGAVTGLGPPKSSPLAFRQRSQCRWRRPQ
jgi:hypothetical protein